MIVKILLQKDEVISERLRQFSSQHVFNGISCMLASKI